PFERSQHELAKQEVHRIIARNHQFDPANEKAFEEWDTIKNDEMVGKIFDAMNMFLGSVGLVTLALGAIGVINIMLVSVTERTKEIGRRKALGATTRSILTQYTRGGQPRTLARDTLTLVALAGLIATVILLMAYGAAFGTAIEHIFDSVGSKVIGVFPGVSTQQAGGAKAGVKVRLERVDVDRLSNTVPNLKHITPEMYLRTTAVDYGARSFPLPVTGTEPPAAVTRKLVPAMGRFFNQQDNQQRARVAVIGSEARTKLFSGQFPIGE